MLATRTYPNHLLLLAHRNAFACCLPATPMTLGIFLLLEAAGVLAVRTYPNHLLM
ncbi:hypothetical protein [Yersinia bercovieri]|uniref:hypothetical protein n=1 Tax=Yersinia bercovieri TaxID=634 RepID=UPI001643B740|nr:hypothetical protein [Yersinia bercovieri]